MDYIRELYSKENEPNIITTSHSFLFWQTHLLEKCARIFRWTNLPFPQREIELRLACGGYCGFVRDKKAGLMVAYGGQSGPTQYFDIFRDFTFSAPEAEGGTFSIASSVTGLTGGAVIIRNNAMSQPMMPLINRTASLLAHTDVSLKIALVNGRESNTFSVEDDDVAKSVRSYHDKIYQGNLDVIIDDSLAQSIVNLTPPTSNTSNVKDYIDAKKEIMREFFAEIGIKTANEKRERETIDEVASNDMLLLFNISDMLAQREESAKIINTVFGLNVSVTLAPEFTSMR